MAISLIPCLVRLRSEVNTLAPGRDTASDGWIGDAAHASRKSDHNPDARGLVHAIDLDTDLRKPGLTMERIVQFLLARCRSGAETRLTYIIYNRRIWQKVNGWRQQTYTGSSDPHTSHAHCSGSNIPAREQDTSSWHLGELMATQFNADDKAELKSAAASITVTTPFASGGGVHSQVGDGVLNSSYPIDSAPGRQRSLVYLNLQKIYEEARDAGTGADAANAALTHLLQIVGFLDDDFPAGVDPAEDPIVKRVRWALANAG